MPIITNGGGGETAATPIITNGGGGGGAQETQSAMSATDIPTSPAAEYSDSFDAFWNFLTTLFSTTNPFG